MFLMYYLKWTYNVEKLSAVCLGPLARRLH